MWGHSTYLVLILVWAMPIIVIQWLLGTDLLVRRWKVLIPGILLPTLYLTFVDSFALRSGTWTISSLQSLDIFLPVIGVPIEEAIFFLVTNTLIVQGMILFRERARLEARVRRVLMTVVRRKPGVASGEQAS
jgi:lycopene cyclase domain-containing protein